MIPGGMSDLTISEWDPPADCHECGWELALCTCLPDPPNSCSMSIRVRNPREAYMMTERQADILIAGHDVLVNQIERTLIDTDDSRQTAERVIATVADWLTRYRPSDFGDDYCTPLDVTAFILRKGETLD